jgi:hypothetical protein
MNTYPVLPCLAPSAIVKVQALILQSWRRKDDVGDDRQLGLSIVIADVVKRGTLGRLDEGEATANGHADECGGDGGGRNGERPSNGFPPGFYTGYEGSDMIPVLTEQESGSAEAMEIAYFGRIGNARNWVCAALQFHECCADTSAMSGDRQSVIFLDTLLTCL